MTSLNNITTKRKQTQLKKLSLVNIFTNTIGIFLIIAIILLIINPTRYIKSILNGTNLFYNSVMPSLLPFFFISKILLGLGTFKPIIKICKKPITKIFGVPPITSYVFLMSILCGYPVGAKIIGELVKDNIITNNDAKRMISLCSTSGPIFVIGTVGASILGSAKLGVLIFISHILASVCTGFILNLKREKNKTSIYNTDNYIANSQNILYNSVNSTIISILTVAVYISIFYMFIDIAYDIKILGLFSNLLSKIFMKLNIEPYYATGISSGIIEMTRGIVEIKDGTSLLLKLVIASSLVSFGGLSIIIQSLTFLSNTKINTLYFLFVKCVQVIFSIIFAIILGLICL